MGLGALCVLVLFAGMAQAGFSDNLLGKGKSSDADSASKAAPPAVLPVPGVALPPNSVKVPRTRVPGGRAVGPFDIVGLRLGMTQDEAVNLVLSRRRELNGKPIVFEVLKEGKHETLVHGEVPRTRFVALSDVESVLRAFDLSEEPGKTTALAQDPKVQRFVAGGQIEAFAFQFPNVPNVPGVSSIVRMQRLAPPVLRETVRDALIQKYGAPTIDERFELIWLTDKAGTMLPLSSPDVARCRGFIPPPVAQAEPVDYSIFAVTECGDRLSVQFQGNQNVTMLILTTLIHHQRLVDQREATKNAALTRFGLAPEQTKSAPAPQF